VKVRDILSKDFLKVDINDTLSKFIGKAKKYPDDDALVFDGKKYVGAIYRQSLLKSKTDITKTKVKLKSCLSYPYVAKPDDDVKKAAEMLFVSDSRILPVKEKDRIIGVVKTKDIIKLIKGKQKAKQVGSIGIIALNQNERYGNAINVMKEKKIGRVPIVDDKGELVGIVTLKDWMKKYLIWPKRSDFGVRETGLKSKSGTREYKDKDNLLSLPIQDVMREYDLVTASPDATVTEIVNLMLKEDVPSVILVKDKKPVGLVTSRDLLRFYVTRG